MLFLDGGPGGILMATCPECGGRVVPGFFASLKPSSVFGCRWCNALLTWPRSARFARDLVLAAGLVAAVAVPLWLTSRFRSPHGLVAGLAVIGVTIALAWLLGALLPLRTLRGRDVWPARERRDPRGRTGA